MPNNSEDDSKLPALDRKEFERLLDDPDHPEYNRREYSPYWFMARDLRDNDVKGDNGEDQKR